MAELWKPLVGQAVDGVFPLLEYLSGDENHAVFLTEREGTKAAIKLVRADSRSAESELARWKRAAKLSHPHLVQLFRSGECRLGGSPVLYAVMEYAEENLSQVLPDRPLTPAEVREMLGPALDALAYLHRKGFVHGRLKPSNIMAAGDQVKVSNDCVRRTGEQNLTPADDVWALGATMVEALTQRPPALGETGEVALPAALEDPFLDIALHALRRNPQDRWSISEISSRLGQPVARSPSRMWRYAVPMLAAAALAMFAGRGLVTRRPEPSPAPAVQVELPKPAPPLADTRASKAPPSRDRKQGKPPQPPSASDTALGVVEQVLPAVPSKARDSIRGRVRVIVRVRTDPAGRVTDTEVESSTPRFFNAISQKAAERWKFQPAPEPQEWLLRFQFLQTETTASAERVAR